MPRRWYGGQKSRVRKVDKLLRPPAARRSFFERLEARRVLSISPSDIDEDAAIERPYVADEMIVAFRTAANGLSADLAFAQWEIRDKIVRPVLDNADILSSALGADGQQLQLVHFTLTPGTDVPKIIGELSDRREIVWAVPNYLDAGNPGSMSFGSGAEGAGLSASVNVGPQNFVPPALRARANSPLVFSQSNGNAISIVDVDAGINNIRTTLTASGGVLTLSGTTGLSFDTGDGSADATFTITGTLANINTALAGLTFEPSSGLVGAASLQIFTDDLGSMGTGGSLTDTDIIPITLAIPSAGKLDPTFDFDGWLTTPLGSKSSDRAYGVAVQADGKVVAVGDMGVSFGASLLTVTRFNADGSLDSSFDGDGKLIFEHADTATGVAIQPDGKIVVIGDQAVASVVARFLPDGSLDTTFSGDGWLSQVFAGTSTDGFYAVQLQPDGKILVGGRAAVGVDYHFLVVRYNADGSLDTTFDADGKATIPAPTGSMYATSMALQADGRIVVAGYSGGSNIDMAFARLNPDGSLDTSFNLTGKLILPVGDSYDRVMAVAVQADGRIVGAGLASNGPNHDVALVRLNADGTLDATFDGDGKVVTPIGANHDTGLAVVIQPDQKILVGGNSLQGTYDFALLRYDSNGALDTTFDSDGVLVAAPGPEDEMVLALALQADGKILATGFSNNGSEDDIVVARYLSDGQSDISFSGDGIATAAYGPTAASANSVFLQADGKIVAVGTGFGGENDEFAVVRYLPNGALDTTFGVGGYVTTPFSATSQDWALDVLVQPDGKIVVVGTTNFSTAVVRYNSDGSLDTSFGTGGKVTPLISPGSDVAVSVALLPDGKILVGGYAQVGSNLDFAAMRFSSDGSLDATFDGDGLVTVDISGGNDQTREMVVQPDGKIVLVGVVTVTSIGIVRLNVDGTLDSTFDGDGKRTISGSAPGSIAIGPNGRIVIAGASPATGAGDFAVIVLHADGSPDTSFDGDGMQITPFGGGTDLASSVAVQADGKIVVGGQAFGVGDQADFALARYNVNGSLDASFDGDGKVVSALSQDYDTISELAIQPDGRIVVVGSSTAGGLSHFTVARYEGDPPTTTGIANQEGADGQPHHVNLFPSFADATDLDTEMAYAVTWLSNPTLLASTSIDGVTGVLTISPAASASGSTDLRVRATDRSGLFVETTFKYTTSGVIEPVTISAPTSITARASNPYYFTDLNDGRIAISAPDVGNLPIQVTLTTTYGKLTLSNLAGLTFATGDGAADSTMTFTGTLAAVNVAIDGLEFDPTPGQTGAATVQISASDLGNSGAGSALTDSEQISFVLVPVSTGALDLTFDSDGKTTTDVSVATSDQINAVALQSDGKVVAVGRRTNPSVIDFAVLCYSTDGSLDDTFDGDGKVVLTGFDAANDVAIQADGKIVVVGLSSTNYAIARFHPDGSLDTTFSGDGLATLDVQLADEAFGVVIQPDGKIVVAGTSNASVFSAARFLSDGTLDTTFDGDGKTTIDVASGAESLNAVAIQPDGKIVLAGFGSNGSNDDFAVARLNADGSLDTSFDGDGKTLTPIGTGADVALDCIVQSDGKIVLAGYMTADIALVRYNSNGSLDTSFDGDGKVTTAIGASSELAYKVLQQPDGKLVAVGSVITTAGATEFAVVRFNTNGTLDPTFDSDGRAVISLGIYNDAAFSAVLQPDGKIVAAGFATIDNLNPDFALARITPSGSLDDTFGDEGRMTTNVGGSHGQAYGVAIQDDGKIVAVGRGYNGTNEDFAVARYLADGKLDPTFDGDGLAVTQVLVNNNENATAVAIQPDGKILAAGSMAGDFAVVRYHPDGTLDNTFDGDGKVSTGVGTSTDTGKAMALQSDGKIVVVGNALGATTNLDFGVIRLNPDGSLDTTFSGDGRTTTATPGNVVDQANAVAIQADGKIIVAGSTVIGGSTDFAVFRYNVDGSQDFGFGAGGFAIVALDGNDQANAVAIQPDGKIVVAGYSNTGDFAVVRFNSNGTLDNTFDSDGKVTTSVGPAVIERAMALRIQPDGKIVIAGSATNNPNGIDFAMVRYNPNGSLDSTFDGDGRVITTLSAGNDVAQAIALQPDGRVVLAGYSDMGGYDNFAIARYEGDAPAVAAIAPVIVNEDAAPTEIDLFAAFNDATDADTSLIYSIYHNSNPGLFSSAVISAATGKLTLSYPPNVSGTASMIIRAKDTSGLVSDASVTITVNSVNDAPSFALTGNAPTVNQDAGPQSVPGFAANISPGPANEAAQAVAFNLSVGSVTGNLTFSSPPAINPATGQLSYTASPGTFGTATVNVTLVDDGSSSPPNVNTSVVQAFTINVQRTSGLWLSSISPTNHGFVASLGQAFDPGVLNLYDQDGIFGSADVTLVGAAVGPVAGSLVIDPAMNKFTFIKSGGSLLPDSYTVTLHSGASAFRTASGELLDGNNNGIAGDNYVGTFTVLSSSAVTLSVPDFTRGFGQTVNVPASGSGIPIALSTGQGVSRADFTLRFDPALLTISGATLGAGIPGASLSFTQSTPGIAVISVSQASQFSGTEGPITLVSLTAQVPNTAPYGAQHLLDLTDLHLFNAAPTPVEIPALDDDGIHVAAYLGDANSSQTYNSPDATFAQRLIVGTYTGFSSYPLTDPFLIVDANRNGAVQSDDVTTIQRAIVGLPTSEVPPLPGLPPQDALTSALDAALQDTDDWTL